MARNVRPPVDPVLEIADWMGILAGLVVLGLDCPLRWLGLVLLAEVVAFRILHLVRPPCAPEHKHEEEEP